MDKPGKVKKTKSSKPAACERCSGTNLIRRITTYPVHVNGPGNLKQINVGRVALHECSNCGHLMPTPAGMAKIERNVAFTISFVSSNFVPGNQK